MCGRYSQTRSLADLKSRFQCRSALAELSRRFNLAPSQPAAVVVADGDRVLDLYRWGLIPSWAKDPKIGYKMINARAETVAEKPSYRRPFQRQRCLVPADGFYEWRIDPTKPPKAARTPMRIVLKSNEPFAFAGLWDHWKDAEGRETRSFTILTTAANDLVASIHDRMPVILQPQDEAPWLDPSSDPDTLLKLLKPYPSEAMTTYQVSQLVNSPRNDSPDCLVPASS
jgi:putative SOS response-associated peptidase YedK